MPRQLSAIEIAEGALLADIAVILQLFAMYLPVFDTFIRLLIPIVFAVLVLRRRLYAAVLCLCVTCFIVSALSGLALLVPMLLSCGAGLYLGQTMKRRLPHAIVVLLGMTSGALAVCGVLVLFTLLAGLPLASIARQLDRSYQAATALAELLLSWVGYGDWWRQAAAPALAPLARAALDYWWALFPALIWLFLCPVVIMVYFITNVAVRLLGYEVRPFPGGWAERLLLRLGRRLVGLRRRFGHRRSV
ncbi:MAG: DUF2232 domain-containing protein [Kouleothrix sp.]|nr:DUF2232 domain-containing protein [Kouleothrix sp.]